MSDREKSFEELEAELVARIETGIRNASVRPPPSLFPPALPSPYVAQASDHPSLAPLALTLLAREAAHSRRPAPSGAMLPTLAALLAVVVSLVTLYATTAKHAELPTASAAEPRAPAASASAAASHAPLTCGDAAEPRDAKKPEPAPSAQPAVSAPRAAFTPRPVMMVIPKRTTAPTPTVATDAASPRLDDAARTAKMLREQLAPN